MILPYRQFPCVVAIQNINNSSMVSFVILRTKKVRMKNVNKRCKFSHEVSRDWSSEKLPKHNLLIANSVILKAALCVYLVISDVLVSSP